MSLVDRGPVHGLDGRLMPGRAERGNEIRLIGIDHPAVRGAVAEDPGTVGDPALCVAEQRRPRRRVVHRCLPGHCRSDE